MPWLAVELPDELAEELVRLVREGKFGSISEAIKIMLEAYLEAAEAEEAAVIHAAAHE